MPSAEAATNSRFKAHGEEKYKRGNNGAVLVKRGDVWYNGSKGKNKL